MVISPLIIPPWIIVVLALIHAAFLFGRWLETRDANLLWATAARLYLVVAYTWIWMYVPERGVVSLLGRWGLLMIILSDLTGHVVRVLQCREEYWAMLRRWLARMRR